MNLDVEYLRKKDASNGIVFLIAFEYFILGLGAGWVLWCL